MTDFAAQAPIALRSRPGRAWLFSTLGVALSVPLSYFLIDRPLAQLAWDNLRPYRKFFDALTHIVDPFAGVALVVFLCAVSYTHLDVYKRQPQL